MLKLDNNLLDELGLGGLPEDQKRSMLQHIYDTLELRVGTNLANQMTDRQLEEFEKFIDDGGDANQAQALQWLEANLPNYKQVVNDVFEALKLEIKQMAPQIMAASTPQQQAQGTPPSPVQQQPAAMQAQVQPQAVPQGMPPANQSWQQPVSPVGQPYATPYQAPQSPVPVQQPQQQQDGQVYQFPAQQPPAGPGGYQAPPYGSGGQRAA